MAATALAQYDRRDTPREEVHYRTRATGSDGRPVSVLLVNISAGGCMARTEGDLPVGESLRITLPVVGTIRAEIRWALGGRIGCALERPIALADYYEVLAALIKGR